MKTKVLILYVIFLIFNTGNIVAQNDFYSSDSVQEIRIYFKEKNWNHLLDSLYNQYDGSEESRIPADIIINGTAIHDVGIRYKGYSSESAAYLKNPFNVKLDYKVSNRNYKGYTSLKLANVTSDPSFIREALSYEIVRKYMPAPRANFANVYVNDTLAGLYSNVEAVNNEFTQRNFNSVGNSFFKGVPPHPISSTANNANLAYLGVDSVPYYNSYEVESDNGFGWSDLINLTYTLNNDTAHLASILNIDRALWMIALDYTLVNLDSYIGYSQNYYIYKDDFGRFNTIIWDMNMSFGGFKITDGISVPPYGFTLTQLQRLNPLKMLTSTTLSPRPLIVNLLKNSTYKRMYLAHIRTILNENFHNNLYLTRGRELDSTIDSYVQNDTNKFYPYSAFLLNLDTTVTVTNNYPPYTPLTITGIKNLMIGRLSYLDTIRGMQGAPAISNIIEPVLPEQGCMAYITATVTGANEVFLGYRFNTGGIFTRVSMQNNGDGTYTGSFLLSGKTVQYYIYAQNDSAGIFSPERAEYEYYSIQPKLKNRDIAINEFMAVNSGTLYDPIGGYNEWIEILNTTSENQSLKSLYLSDDKTNLSKWAIPDTVIKAKSYIIVWADNSNLTNGLHSNFTLSEDGGQLFISYGNNQYLDSVKYGLQMEGETYGRYPNGYGDFDYMLPTFAKNNYMGIIPLSDILLFPNPAVNNIYIEMRSPEKYLSYGIYNSTGQKVISGNFDFESSFYSSGLYQFDISNLQSGLYVIKIETTGDSVIKKFIINK